MWLSGEWRPQPLSHASRLAGFSFGDMLEVPRLGNYEQFMIIRAVYPGTFDPVTNGHIDLIQRSAALFDKVIVAILKNTDKIPLFSLDERVEMLEAVVKDLPNVSVTTFGGLLVDFAERIEASVIVRGIRAISDYEYELQMALMNRRLSGKVETVFMMPAEAYSYLSSRLVKEISLLGGSVHGLVPEIVEKRLQSKYRPPVEA
jgi:pantetheine-phosphate adenylyltransferase